MMATVYPQVIQAQVFKVKIPICNLFLNGSVKAVIMCTAIEKKSKCGNMLTSGEYK